MLIKLLKYEIKATARILVPLYLVLIFFAVINRIYSAIPDKTLNTMLTGITEGISMAAYMTLMVGTMVMTIILLIQRFYKNLLGDEGYLMFTLPVQSWKHILSKLITAMLWVFSSGIVAVTTIFIIMPGDVFRQFRTELSQFIEEIYRFFGSGIYFTGFESVVLFLLGLASSILMIYGAIALGHLFNKYKLLASFLMYIILRTVTQVIQFIFFAIIGNTFLMKLSNMPTVTDIQVLLLFGIIYIAIITVGCFVLTQYILKNRLNLE